MGECESARAAFLSSSRAGSNLRELMCARERAQRRRRKQYNVGGAALPPFAAAAARCASASSTNHGANLRAALSAKIQILRTGKCVYT